MISEPVHFHYYGGARVSLGGGSVKNLAQLPALSGKKVFLVVSPSVAAQPAFSDFWEKLCAHSLPMAVYQRGEPTVADISTARQTAVDFGAEAVIGVGGGSAMDAAKAIAALAVNKRPARDYLEGVGAGAKLLNDPLPFYAVPTTGGTGSEVTRNAVICDRELHFKKSLRDSRLPAKEVYIDSDFLISAPKRVTAESGFDALTQLVESYVSSHANIATRSLAKQGLERVRALPLAYREGENRAAREDVSLAALLSGVCLAETGLGAVHGIAAAVGSYTAEGHGKICGILLPHVMRFNLAVSRANYDKIAEILLGEANADKLIAQIELWQKEMQIPPDFQYLSLPNSVFCKLLPEIFGNSMRTNPVQTDIHGWEGLLRPLFGC